MDGDPKKVNLGQGYYFVRFRLLSGHLLGERYSFGLTYVPFVF